MSSATSSLTSDELVERLIARKQPDKDLGQHYLISDEALDRAVELAALCAEDHVLEVGPGPGTLSQKILRTGARLCAIEIDPVTCEHLRDNISNEMNLIEGDALRVRLPQDLSAVVANIPFQISSPLIDRLAQHQRQYSGINSIVLLLQEEFAARLCMSEGVSSRGSLGMTTAMEWNAKLDIKVHSHAFKPAPKVHSRLVHLTPNDPISKMEEGIPRPEPRLARLVVSTAFKERRKKMRNRLRQAPKHISRVKGWHASGYREAAKALLEKPDRMGLPLGWQEARPEQLDLQTWLTVAGWLQRIHDEKEPVY